MRYPRIRDTEPRYDYDKNLLCRNCDNKVAQNRRHYCSEECMQTYVENHSWFFIRKAVLRRDKWKCQICEKKFLKKQLDVDHIIPVQMGGQLFDKGNLRAICKECHKRKTKLDREALK